MANDIEASIAAVSGAWSSQATFGFDATHVRLYNSGSVPLRVSWDGSTRAVRLLAGERRLRIVNRQGDAGTAIDGLYAWGEGGTPTLYYEATSYAPIPEGAQPADAPFALDAANITYTPDDLSDWDGGTDPGGTGNGLDQAAGRLADIEDGSKGSAAIVVGAEAANVINVAATITDRNGSATTTPLVFFQIYLAADMSQPAAAAFTADDATGTVQGPDVASVNMLVQAAAGIAAVDVTDVVGGSSTSLYVRVVCAELGIDTLSAIVTFDGA